MKKPSLSSGEVQVKAVQPGGKLAGRQAGGMSQGPHSRVLYHCETH